MTQPNSNNVPSSQQWFSLGLACQLMQITPGQLEVLLEDLDVGFDAIWDNVPMLRGDTLLAVSRRCGEVRDEITAAANSSKDN